MSDISLRQCISKQHSNGRLFTDNVQTIYNEITYTEYHLHIHYKILFQNLTENWHISREKKYMYIKGSIHIIHALQSGKNIL